MSTLTLDLYPSAAPDCGTFRVDLDDIWRNPRRELMSRLTEASENVERSEVDRVLSLMRTPDKYLETLWAHYLGVLLCREPSFDYHCRFSVCIAGASYRVDYYPPETGFAQTALGCGSTFHLYFRGPEDGPLTSTGYYGPIFMGARPAYLTPVEFAQADAEMHICKNAPKSGRRRN